MRRRRGSGTRAPARDRDGAVAGWTAWRRRWLRNLGAVQQELAHERFPGSADEGLSEMAALCDIALTLLASGGPHPRRRRRTPRA